MQITSQKNGVWLGLGCEPAPASAPLSLPVCARRVLSLQTVAVGSSGISRERVPQLCPCHPWCLHAVGPAQPCQHPGAPTAWGIMCQKYCRNQQTVDGSVFLLNWGREWGKNDALGWAASPFPSWERLAGKGCLGWGRASHQTQWASEGTIGKHVARFRQDLDEEHHGWDWVAGQPMGRVGRVQQGGGSGIGAGLPWKHLARPLLPSGLGSCWRWSCSWGDASHKALPLHESQLANLNPFVLVLSYQCLSVCYTLACCKR